MSDKFYMDLLAAGFGGQGIMMLGQLVAYSGIHQGRHVTWIPAYGPEMRGGTANCSCVVSSEEIGSPVVGSADVVVVMNQPSLEKFAPRVKPGGYLIYNSDLVEYSSPRTDVTVLPVPAQTMAHDLGSDRVANIIMLGVIVKASGMVSKEDALETIKEKLGAKKPKFLPMNLEAFDKGMSVAEELINR
ncbi:2-oxoacid:acceptor oxidoreductase family protein [Dethiosulfovibrio sp. F2B]|uniref:2-oxoacid:acceptor oxidoreductase family protein n=1 Tax=Dethiosulfovibrio faecalis TaxID=2720018 RepID=UPI001F2B400B|nr:2-oxoacid:acceptor oxidoreductase family protein [Dethiosulfovibrio faecalis]MCF4150415.1 2-oxoacid:acceptor oxidoreductase family protein [Dethiosulfovibrio faecalis]